MPASSISGLPELSQSALAAKDVIAVVSLGSAETKKISTENYVLGAVSKLPDASIDGQKIDFTSVTIEFDTDNIVDGAVTAEKLGDESTWVVDPSAPAAGKFVGQALLNTTTGYAYVWNGSAWVGFKAVNSINSVVTQSVSGNIALASVQAGDEVTVSAAYGVTSEPRAFVAGPTGNAGAISQRQIVSTDLPVATDANPGAIVPGQGLAVDGTGSLTIDNSVDAQSNRSVVTYDSNGLVTSGGPIESADLPIATDTTLGAVMPGPDLSVDSSGELVISNTVTPGAGTYVKVQVSDNGLVQQGFSTLSSDDIGDLDYSQITSGQVQPGSIADGAVEKEQLADYATCYMQEGNPGVAEFLGSLWYQPSTAQLRIYARGSAGNQWLPIGFGALQASNLRWMGTFNADTNTVGVVTDFGQSAGLTAGATVPGPSDALGGGYLVCQVGGSNMDQLDIASDTFTPGDWCLCVNAAQGWIHIDSSATNGGGGGGSTQYLNDLLDVTIADPGGNALQAGQRLAYDGTSGMWVNDQVIEGGDF
jgi:hypothetical protein